jgi:hypothetical protein
VGDLIDVERDILRRELTPPRVLTREQTKALWRQLADAFDKTPPFVWPKRPSFWQRVKAWWAR